MMLKTIVCLTIHLPMTVLFLPVSARVAIRHAMISLIFQNTAAHVKIQFVMVVLR